MRATMRLSFTVAAHCVVGKGFVNLGFASATAHENPTHHQLPDEFASNHAVGASPFRFSRNLASQTSIMPDTSSSDDTEPNLELHFSIWHDSFRSHDVDMSAPSEVQVAVVQAMEEFLCADAHVDVVSREYPQSSVCSSAAVDDGSNDNTAYRSVVVRTNQISVDDHNATLPDEYVLHWTSWILQFPWTDSMDGVAGTNSRRLIDGDSNATSSATGSMSTNLTALQEEVQSLLETLIADSTMDDRLQQGKSVEVYLSVPGAEIATFGDDEEPPEGNLHEVLISGLALRLFGAAIFFLTFGCTLLFVVAARRRRAEVDEWEKEQEEKSGGLITGQGVDLMLDIGRRHSLRLCEGGAGMELAERDIERNIDDNQNQTRERHSATSSSSSASSSSSSITMSDVTSRASPMRVRTLVVASIPETPGMPCLDGHQ